MCWLQILSPDVKVDLGIISGRAPDWSLLPLQLLAWSAYSPIEYVDSNGTTLTTILDLNTLSTKLIDVTNTKHDMFCPGALRCAVGSQKCPRRA